MRERIEIPFRHLPCFFPNARISAMTTHLSDATSATGTSRAAGRPLRVITTDCLASTSSSNWEMGEMGLGLERADVLHEGVG